MLCASLLPEPLQAKQIDRKADRGRYDKDDQTLNGVPAVHSVVTNIVHFVSFGFLLRPFLRRIYFERVSCPLNNGSV